VSARKIAFLILIVLFAASVETAWNVREHVDFGPQGCRVMGGRFYGPSWSFEATGERPLTGSALRLEVENAFGGVSVVKGAHGVVKVRLRKVVFLPTEERARQLADRIELRLTGDADVVKVATNRDELGRRDEVGFETHLEIEAPEGTAVQVRSEHGRVELTDVAAADVTASFDGVTLEVRHGSVSVERVGGRLQLNSRHGDVTLAGVAGPAKLELQHGNLGARETSALDVELAYGELTAESVGGDLVVRSQHAPVTASDVTGRVEVETSFGGVRLERIGGDARVKVEHGHVAASDISGGFTGDASFDGIELERVHGPVDLKVQHGGVEAKGLESGARVRASGSDVTLEGFAGAIDVEVDRGSARLAPGAAIKADVIASATQGNVALEVPDGSAFQLEAESHRGQVDAEVAGLSAQRDEGRRHGQHVQGRHGAGGPQVRTAGAPAKPPAKASTAPATKPTPSAEATPKTPEDPGGVR
jgi:DUF4097 and DUF4098 domain-containing protein YvlB